MTQSRLEAMRGKGIGQGAKAQVNPPVHTTLPILCGRQQAMWSSHSRRTAMQMAMAL